MQLLQVHMKLAFSAVAAVSWNPPTEAFALGSSALIPSRSSAVISRATPYLYQVPTSYKSPHHANKVTDSGPNGSEKAITFPESMIHTKLCALKSDSSPERKKDNFSFSLSFDLSLHKDRVLARCLLAIIGYMFVGVIGFSCIFEKWRVVDSLYFSVVTFTTVGYGDLVPTTEAGKLFAILFSFAGISIVGALLGYVGGNVIEAERKAIQKTRSAARAAVMQLFDPIKKDSNSRSGNNSATAKTKDNRKLGVIQKIFFRCFAVRTQSDGSKSLLRRAFIDTFAQCYYVFVPFLSLAFYIGKKEGWTPITSMYYAIATASTVGYGDIAPKSPRMRSLSLAFIPLAVISLGEILGRISGYFIRKESNKAEQEFMDRTMTMDSLEAMDANQDGEVDLFEFLTFMLGSMQKVDAKMMNELKDLFESFDLNGSNSIQKEDIFLLAKKRIDKDLFLLG